MGTTAKLNNYLTVNNTVYTDRDSVSGVDLNDEATNLMVYQKAYTAACRLMTVLEEALDSPDQRHGCLRSGTGTIRGIDYDSYYN